MQDLAGYDLNFIEILCNSKINVLLVGDPRQATYSTNNSSKNKKFSKSAILSFFEARKVNIEVDTQSLTTNYRSIEPICDLSNMLFPNLQKTKSGNDTTTDHDGIYLVKNADADIEAYLKEYSPMQLRYNRKTKVSDSYEVMNFGESKGLSFPRVLIYPTSKMEEWLKNPEKPLDIAETTKSKMYVSITRAEQSIAFICDFEDRNVVNLEQKYKVYTIQSKKI